jgi:hypothetical protein
VSHKNRYRKLHLVLFDSLQVLWCVCNEICVGEFTYIKLKLFVQNITGYTHSWLNLSQLPEVLLLFGAQDGHLGMLIITSNVFRFFVLI